MDDARSPFSFRCPDCDADIDAEDAPFELGAAVPTPDRDWMLWEISCHSCGTRTDAVSWLIDGDAMLHLADADGESMAAATLTPDAAGLLDRYLERVSTARNWWLGRLSSDGEMQDYSITIERDAFRLSQAQSFGCASDVLAATRGLRQAVEAFPFTQPNGRLQIGPFLCIASIDEVPDAPHPWALHVSLSHPDDPEDLPVEVQRIVVGLFFTAAERERLQVVPGRTRPMLHWYLPTFPETVRVRVDDALWVQASRGEVLVHAGTHVNGMALPSVAVLEHEELADVVRLCESQSGQWSNRDGSLSLLRTKEGLDLTIQPLKTPAMIQTTRMRREGVAVLHQVIDTVLAARVSGAVERGAGRAAEAELQERYADPDIRAWMSEAKIAIRAAHMMKTTHRLVTSGSDSSGALPASHEWRWEHMMRGSWQRWMGEIRDAAGHHVAAVADGLIAAARPGQTVEISCSELGGFGGGRTWAIILGKRWLPVLQSVVGDRIQAASVSYRFGRILIKS